MREAILPDRPSTRKRVLVPLAALAPEHLNDPLDMQVAYVNYLYLRSVRKHYEASGWKWGKNAEFLFSCLIEALDLGEMREGFLALFRPKRGRPRKAERDALILRLRAEGRNISQIYQFLKNRPKFEDITREAVRDCLKPRHREKQAAAKG